MITRRIPIDDDGLYGRCESGGYGQSRCAPGERTVEKPGRTTTRSIHGEFSDLEGEAGGNRSFNTLTTGKCGARQYRKILTRDFNLLANRQLRQAGEPLSGLCGLRRQDGWHPHHPGPGATPPLNHVERATREYLAPSTQRRRTTPAAAAVSAARGEAAGVVPFSTISLLRRRPGRAVAFA